jgi:hypothetical protein
MFSEYSSTIHGTRNWYSTLLELKYVCEVFTIYLVPGSVHGVLRLHSTYHTRRKYLYLYIGLCDSTSNFSVEFTVCKNLKLIHYDYKKIGI